jgi:flagellar basal-body rod protein FlgF
MIDRLAYTAMTGAKHAMGQLATTSNNLANATTPGFREAIASFRAVPMTGEGSNTRTFVVDSTPTASFLPGVIETTGNPLDFAIEGRGFFALTDPDGNEGYSRAGRFVLNSEGLLKTASGLTVAGQDGDIVIPSGAHVDVGTDGTVSARLPGEKVSTPVGRLKLVNPDEARLVRGEDGLFRVPGEVLESDPVVRVRQGAVESSNVSAANAMVQMISQSRLFDFNVKLMQTAEQNSRAANQLLSLSRG